MSLPVQLHALADRLEAAEAAYRVAIDELRDVAISSLALDDVWAAAEASEAAANDAPGQAREDGATVADGRRAPADAAAPAAIASDRKRTPAPATPRTRIALPGTVVLDRDGRAMRDLLTCPDCDRTFKRQGYAVHRTRIHGDVVSGVRKAPKTNGAAVDDRDPRVIRENCDSCGQPFTWAPALATHRRTCRGKAAQA